MLFPYFLNYWVLANYANYGLITELGLLHYYQDAFTLYLRYVVLQVSSAFKLLLGQKYLIILKSLMYVYHFEPSKGSTRIIKSIFYSGKSSHIFIYSLDLYVECFFAAADNTMSRTFYYLSFFCSEFTKKYKFDICSQYLLPEKF